MAKTKQMVAAHAEFYKKQHQLAQEAMYADNKRFAEERRIEEIAQDKRDEKESRKILGLKKMKSERCASTTLKGVRCKNKVSRDHTCGIHLRKSTEAPQPLPKTGLQINSLGDKEWWFNGKRHRAGGLPAIEGANGDKEWWVDGKLHREGGLPAIERANGDKEWWVNGKFHREGGLPAVVSANGYKAWWVNGKRLRSHLEKTS